MKFSILYLLLLAGYIFSYGTFNIFGLLILSAVFFLLLFKYQDKKTTTKELIFILLSNLLLSVLLEKLLYPQIPYANKIIKILLVLSFIISLNYLFEFSFIKLKFVFYTLLIIGFILRIFIIFASPQPAIDAYHLLKEAPEQLLKGQNPYQTFYTKIYPQVTPDYYTYFPGSIFIFLPAVLLMHDPRWLYLAVYAMIALLVRKIVNEQIKSQLFTLILFYQPLSLIIFEQGFSEILLSGLLLLTFYLLKLKKINLAALLTGTLVSVKQSMIFTIPLLLPFLLSQGRKLKKTLLLFALVPVITISPFVLLNFSAFWRDTIYYHLNINSIRTDLIGFSLNYFSLFYRLFGIDITASPLYSFLLVIILYLLIFWFRKHRKSVRKISSGLAIFFLGFHLFGVQAYMNYYFLISHLLLFNQIFSNNR